MVYNFFPALSIASDLLVYSIFTPNRRAQVEVRDFSK